MQIKLTNQKFLYSIFQQIKHIFSRLLISFLFEILDSELNKKQATSLFIRNKQKIQKKFNTNKKYPEEKAFTGSSDVMVE